MCAVDESVSISEYRLSWPNAFKAERRRLVAALGVQKELIEHIGSTAVYGLVGKPVLDLMLGVRVYPPPEGLLPAIERLGYQSFGEAGVPGRLYYRQRVAMQSNLHVVRFEGDHWVNNLALRDFLQSNASARERYTLAKRSAIASGATSLLAYSAAKATVVSALLQEALAANAGKR